MIHINNTKLSVDDQVVGITGPFIQFALKDIEGYGIDGGVKYGGSSLVYFLDEKTKDKYKDSDAIEFRRIIFSKGHNEDMRVFMEGEYPWQDAFEVESLLQYGRLGFVTVLIVSDITFSGEEIAAAAKALKALGANSVYAFVSHIDTVFLEGRKGSLIDYLNNSDLIAGLFTADIVYENGFGGKIPVINPANISSE